MHILGQLQSTVALDLHQINNQPYGRRSSASTSSFKNLPSSAVLQASLLQKVARPLSLTLTVAVSCVFPQLPHLRRGLPLSGTKRHRPSNVSPIRGGALAAAARFKLKPSAMLSFIDRCIDARVEPLDVGN
ncbi:hypothetical protein EVAR_48302_1 [Eumeta japonica]|uniref:Uncharacterized protein n=1 Tax=Eumeta variegata TaxID=151549 RepID=A0A4C1WMZ6_EUMVA|nr:hypothetical protein EVAR_48302_1 [Eumeta japonica]